MPQSGGLRVGAMLSKELIDEPPNSLANCKFKGSSAQNTHELAEIARKLQMALKRVFILIHCTKRERDEEGHCNE